MTTACPCQDSRVALAKNFIRSKSGERKSEQEGSKGESFLLHLKSHSLSWKNLRVKLLIEMVGLFSKLGRRQGFRKLLHGPI
ncbi:MAG: hypothetical protein H6Q41_192 [Deltaproteobacteria bacterium]|nr:hypothetical protein [Deltaproteobacteria bacterium]